MHLSDMHLSGVYCTYKQAIKAFYQFLHHYQQKSNLHLTQFRLPSRILYSPTGFNGQWRLFCFFFYIFLFLVACAKLITPLAVQSTSNSSYSTVYCIITYHIYCIITCHIYCIITYHIYCIIQRLNISIIKNTHIGN